MATAELQPEPFPRAVAERWTGYAFGVVLECDDVFPGVMPTTSAASGRSASWREVSREEIEGAWRPDAGEILFERRHPDGRLFLQVDTRPERGFRIWAPYYGRHLVDLDGQAIASALPRVPPVRWQRLFFAQVLPLAAALQGMSLFHASAVALDGRVLPFIGPSGIGKTSLTAHLVSLGASFFTDDVLALEPRPGGVLAHPGPARLSIDDRELRRIPSAQAPRLGPCLGRSDKLMLATQPVETPLPVACLYYLRPDSEATHIVIEERRTEPGRTLLGSSFINYLRSPGYLERHLVISAALDASVQLYDIRIPRGFRPRDIAARVLEHRDELSGR